MIAKSLTHSVCSHIYRYIHILARKIVQIVCSNFSYDGETLDIVPNPVFKVIIKNNLSNKKLNLVYDFRNWLLENVA